MRSSPRWTAFGLHSDATVEWPEPAFRFYQAALERLLAQGIAFECHCSRSDLAANGGIHRACVGNTRRPEPAVRLRVADGSVVAFDDRLQGRFSQDVASEVGDFVLKRADGLWAYQLAVVVDDAAQGITDVVRGADLLDSTPRQILLQQALGLPTPRYAHLPLVVDARRPQTVQVRCRASGRCRQSAAGAARGLAGAGAGPCARCTEAQMCLPCWLRRWLSSMPSRLPRVDFAASRCSAQRH